jgi:flagellar basal-body rod protein FlgB
MSGLELFTLASMQRSWLSTRQSLVAANIANANTPRYTQADVISFDKALDRAATSEMTATNARHLGATGGLRATTFDDRRSAWDISYSGNSVSLDQQMLRAGEVSRGFEVNAAITRSFQRMLLMSLKG